MSASVVENALTFISESSIPLAPGVREQCANAKASTFELTQFGLFSKVEIPKGVKLTDQPQFQFKYLFGKHPALKNDFGVILYFESSILQEVEFHTFGDESWPREDWDKAKYYFRDLSTGAFLEY